MKLYLVNSNSTPNFWIFTIKEKAKAFAKKYKKDYEETQYQGKIQIDPKLLYIGKDGSETNDPDDC